MTADDLTTDDLRTIESEYDWGIDRLLQLDDRLPFGSVLLDGRSIDSVAGDYAECNLTGDASLVYDRDTAHAIDRYYISRTTDDESERIEVSDEVAEKIVNANGGVWDYVG